MADYDRKCGLFMFLDNLSRSLLEIIERNKLSYEKFAHKCGLSPRFITKIINLQAVPTIKSLEKICKSVDCTPNELFRISPESERLYRSPLSVTEIKSTTHMGFRIFYAACPRCGGTISRSYQHYCDNCGQKLNWDLVR